ncbi:MAG: N-acetyltransferase family protein [Chloroflexota bacterium]
MAAVIDVYRDEDAAALAAMWNESDASWPRGFNARPPKNAALMSEWIAAHEALARFVAKADGRIVGYCDLAQDTPDSLYIPLLNVHPGYRGQGVGRDLLLRALSQAVAAGQRRLRLTTWPANSAAVPLYKKVGFFWVPGTAVEMVNFLPLVMGHPLAARYFAHHDWYRTQRRELRVSEDYDEWRGQAAYVYRFADGDDRLVVAIDHRSGCIMAVDTPRLTVEGWPLPQTGDSPWPAIGVSITAASGAEVRVAVSAGAGFEATPVGPQSAPASGEPLAFTVDLRPAAVTDGAGSAPAEARARILASTDAGATEGWVDVAVPQPDPVRVSYTGDHVLHPGEARRLNFMVENRLPAAVTVEMLAEASGGVTISRGQTAPLALAIPAGSVAGFDLEAGARAGTGRIRLTGRVLAGGGLLRTITHDVWLLAPSDGVPVAATDGDRAWLANEFVAVGFEGRRLVVTDRLAGRRAVAVAPLKLAGVPDGGERDCRFRTVQSGDGMSVEQTWCAGGSVTVTRRVSLIGPIVSVADRLSSAGALAGATAGADLRARFTVWSLLRSGRLAVPLASGITTGEIIDGEYPLGLDYRDEAGLLSEQWLAAWDGDGAVGLICDGRPTVVFWSRCLAQVTHRLAPISRDWSTELPPVRLYVGPGDWRAVRAVWAGRGRSARRCDPVAVTSVELAPRPVICAAPDLTLTADNRRESPRGGRIEVSLPPGWQAEPRAVDVDHVSLGRGLAVPIAVTSPPGAPAGAAPATIIWRAASGDLEQRQPVFSVQGAGRVEVSPVSGGEWEIRNGRLSAKLAPEFAGCLYSLRDLGRELLASAYPAPATFVDIAPWYGGLHPQTSYGRADWPGRGQADRYATRHVAVRGRRGFMWEGIRITVAANPPAAAWRSAVPAVPAGIARSLDLLTLPGSNIIAVVTRVSNATGADLDIGFGWNCYPLRPPGANLRYMRDTAGADDAPQTRTAASGHATLQRCDWLAIGAGAELVVVSPDALLRADDYGAAGVLISAPAPLRVEAGQTSERLCFIISAASGEEALLYREFCRVSELP